MGFNWTLYRTSILVCILMYLNMSKRIERLVEKSAYIKWIYLLSIWFVWGVVLLLVSPYRDYHNGFIELLSVFNGLMCFFIVLSVIRSTEDLKQIVSIVYYVYLMLVIIGLMEIFTQFHLPMSIFNDETVSSYLFARKGATGVFYSENDFSTFLACFVPILMCKNKHKILSLVTTIGAIVICSYNDANICLIAMLFGLGYFFLFLKKYGKNDRYVIRWVMLVILLLIVILIWNCLDALSDHIALLNVIRVQQINAVNKQGSLYVRMVMYLDSLKAAFNTFFLGIGPAAFSNYFMENPSKSGLINPHNLYLEILVEYGLIILMGFCFCIFGLLNRLRKRVYITEDKMTRIRLIAGCEMVFIYSIACIASSSFIGYAWQWVLIAICTAFSGVRDNVIAMLDNEKCNYHVCQKVY